MTLKEEAGHESQCDHTCLYDKNVWMLRSRSDLSRVLILLVCVDQLED